MNRLHEQLDKAKKDLEEERSKVKELSTVELELKKAKQEVELLQDKVNDQDSEIETLKGRFEKEKAKGKTIDD